MYKKIARRWVDALRSGRYEQGRGFLRTNRDGVHRFCCLGVLCDIAVEDEVVQLTSATNYNDGTVLGYLDTAGWGITQTTFPSQNVGKWAGMLANVCPCGACDRAPADERVLEFKWEVKRSSLPKSVQAKIPESYRVVAFAALNDSFAASFEDIAEAIENEWLTSAESDSGVPA